MTIVPQVFSSHELSFLESDSQRGSKLISENNITQHVNYWPTLDVTARTLAVKMLNMSQYLGLTDNYNSCLIMNVVWFV